MTDDVHTEQIVDSWPETSEETPDTGDAVEAASPDSEFVAAEAKRDEYLADLQRLAADFDNFRKRALRDQQAYAARAAERLVAKLLPVLDDLERALEAMILLSGANPSAQLPLSRMIQRRGDILSYAVGERIADRPDIVRAFNWPDRELSSPSYWSEDRLHMNSRGHHRVAARVLTALGMEPPAAWWSLPQLPDAARIRGATYYREHLGPWVRRRLTGTSSGDGRVPKHPEWTLIEPSGV